MAETIHVRGEGGVIWEMDLPLPEGVAQRLASGVLTRVNADGSPFEPDPAQERPARPKDNASTEKWAEYARTLGATDEDVEGLSRADLIELYGG